MTSKINRPVALVILDGWGVSPDAIDNAIERAHTPNYDAIQSRYPMALLDASGESVGLVSGTPGNAEAGHVNLGAGRVVKSDVARIGAAIRSGELFENAELKRLFESSRDNGKPVHLVGLVSDGGVHSSSSTLYALLSMAKREGVKDVFVHCILDGRDVPARSADIFLEALEIKMAEIGVGKIASLCGRHFAMDAGENWDRTARAFTMMVHAEGERATDPVTAIRSSFLRGIADEFTAPIVMESAPDIPVAAIKDGDGVIFFNHRADTMRQLVRALAVPDPGSGTASAKPLVDVVCMIDYDRSFDLNVAFPHDDSGSSLNSILMENEIENWRIAETERYPHVTGFMNASSVPAGHYQRNVLVNATRPSHRLPEPEMASFKLADQLIRSIEESSGGFHIANFSAADLAAESGDLDRTVEAVQFIDTCLGGVLDVIEENKGVLIVASTHGNCEAVGKHISANQLQAGTTNDVPFLVVDASGEKTRLREKGSMQDIAPTILGLLGIGTPSDMTGIDLRMN